MGRALTDIALRSTYKIRMRLGSFQGRMARAKDPHRNITKEVVGADAHQQMGLLGARQVQPPAQAEAHHQHHQYH
jgi:hypothetical protein